MKPDFEQRLRNTTGGWEGERPGQFEGEERTWILCQRRLSVAQYAGPLLQMASSPATVQRASVICLFNGGLLFACSESLLGQTVVLGDSLSSWLF